MQRYRFKDTVTIDRKGKHMSIPIDIDMDEDLQRLCMAIRNLYYSIEIEEAFATPAAIFDVIEAFYGRGRAFSVIISLGGDVRGVVECLCMDSIRNVLPKISKLYKELYNKPLQVFDGVLQ